jgi:hypothetical protein
MSIAEMKLAAIQEIGMLNNQDAVKEILEHLEKLNGNSTTMLNIAKEIIEERKDVLEKLAQ